MSARCSDIVQINPALIELDNVPSLAAGTSRHTRQARIRDLKWVEDQLAEQLHRIRVHLDRLQLAEDIDEAERVGDDDLVDVLIDRYVDLLRGHRA